MPAYSKIHLIFNPHSGHGFYLPLFTQLFLGLDKPFLPALGSPERMLQEILKNLKDHHIQPDYTIANSSQKAENVARRCARDGCELVIAAGGDGTLNAVANGLAGTETVMAIIPTGTINLFALQLNLPKTISGACRLVTEGRVRMIDLGQINQRYFVCIAGIGFDAFVIKYTEWQWKKVMGSMVYFITALWGFFTYPFCNIYIRMDQQPQVKKGYLIFVGNAKYYGGKMVLLPKADLGDGLLDVCILKKRNFAGFLRYLLGLRRGKLEEYIDVEYFQCRELAVMNRTQYVQVDGEFCGRLPVKIKIAPQALKIMIPDL